MSRLAALKILPLVLLLAACQGSPAWYMTHPERKNITINERVWTVVPNGNNRYDVFYGGFIDMSDMIQIKKDQIEAVEKSTNCKVIESERHIIDVILQTHVKC